VNEKLWNYSLQMTRLFGVDDEFGEDAILGRLESMKDVIEQVNKQFKDPVRLPSSLLHWPHLVILYCLISKYFCWIIHL
jgi:hypothetical protein